MKIEAGQVWQLDTQEEFDAFMKMKDEQGVEWNCFEWSLGELKSHVLGVYVFDRDGKVCLSVEDRPISTHYGKDLLKEDNMFKVGDRVKVVKGRNVTAYTKGWIGKVKNVGIDDALVEFDDEKSWFYYLDDLKKTEKEEKPKWQEVEREDKIGSENDTLIVLQNTETKELRLTRGCFTGTLDEFETAVKRKPEGDKWRIVYEWLIEKYKAKYPDYKKIAYVVKLNEKIYKSGENGHSMSKEYAVKYSRYNDAKLHADKFGGTVEEVEL